MNISSSGVIRFVFLFQSVIVKSTERNISRVYEARKILLSLMTETQSSSSASNALVSAETSKKLSAVSRPGVSNSKKTLNKCT